MKKCGGWRVVSFDNNYVQKTCGLDLVLRDLGAVNVDRLSSLKWHCDVKRA